MGLPAERALVRAMLTEPACIEATTEAIAAIDEETMNVDDNAAATLRDTRLREIHAALLAGEGTTDLSRLAEGLSPEAVEMMENLLSEQASVVNLSATIDDSLRRLKVRWRKERIAALQSARTDDRDRLNAEILRLNKEIQSLSLRPSGSASH
jgi:hypothetical protein